MSKRLVLTAAAAALATFASALDIASVHSTAAASAVTSHHSHHENQHSVAQGGSATSHTSAAAASTVASAATSHGHPSHQSGGSHVVSSHAVASSHHVVSSHVVGSHPQSGSAAAIATEKEKVQQQLETAKPTETPVDIPFTVSEETFLKTLDAWREKQFYGDASAPATPAVASATSAAGSGSKRHADASGTTAPGSTTASGHASQATAASHSRSGSHASVGSHSAAAGSHDAASMKPQVLGRATAKDQAALEKETNAATIRVYFVANVTNFNDQLTGDAPFPTEKPTLGNFLATSSGQSAGRAASGGVQLASISGSAGVASSGAVARAERSKIKAAFAHIFDGSKPSEKQTPRSSAVRPQAASGGADFLPQTGGDAATNARTPAHRTTPLTPQRKLALLLEWEKSLNQNQKGGHHQRKPSMMDRLVSPKTHVAEQRSGLTLQSQRSAAASATPHPDVPTPPSKFFFAAPRGAASAASATSGQQAAPTTVVLARGEKLMSLFDACTADSKRLCQNANPHQETMCLQLHARSLSGQCREYHTAKVFCAMQLHRLGVCDETQPGLGMCIAMNIRHRLLGGTCTNTKYAMYLRMKLTKGGD